ncbi:MAG: hypothetical protein NTX15_11035 [Candidatus Kapabacteria bacterium]|nr:hypothetical protein [Candidatus Kapabacteria bacterium]
MKRPSWKRLVLISLAVLVTTVACGFGVYGLFSDRINKNIHDAIVEYIQSRVKSGAESLSSGKLSIELGDINYTFFSGSLDVHRVRVGYHDSTEARGRNVSVDIPLISVSGLYPWDILNGGGLSLGTIMIDHPTIAHQAWGQAIDSLDLDAHDTSSMQLPRMPDVDSLMRQIFVDLVPSYVQPLTIGGIRVSDVDFKNSDDNPAALYRGRIHDLSLRVGAITVDASKPGVRPIESVEVSVASWLREYTDKRSIHTRGLHVLVSDKDSSLVVDSIDLRLPLEYTYSATAIRFSYRTRELSIGTFALGPSQKDDDYFAAQKFNSDRFRVKGGAVLLREIDFKALQARTALHVQTIDVGTLELDILSNKRLRSNPKAAPQKMLNQLAQSLPFQLAVDSLVVKGTSIHYGERWSHSATPATLSWKGVSATATGLRNITDQGAPFTITARGRFQDQATMEATFVIPLTSPTYVLDARGSLGRTDVTSLNTFLPIAENVRIRSGIASSASFDYKVRGRACTGKVSPHFTNLYIDLVNKESKKTGGIFNVFVSFVANWLAIKNDNDGEDYKDGVIKYTLPADAAFMQTIWFPVRSGLTKAAGM